MNRLMVILDFAFGCHHPRLSRVFTIGGRTYKVCCDCGGEFNYSLARMRLERSLKALNVRPATIPARNHVLVKFPRESFRLAVESAIGEAEE